MKAFIDRQGTLEGLEQILLEASGRPGAGGILLLTCDENGYQPDTLNPLLKRIEKPIAGGLFPAVFAGREILERGSIAISLPTTPRVLPLSSNQLEETTLREKLVASGLGPHPTMLILTDGLAFHATKLLDALFDVFGLDIKYLGGGAGSLTLQQRPCLLTNDGFTRDGAVVMALDLDCGIGVAHGHKKVEGPHQITAASGNRVYSLDWQPAASYFRELVQKQLSPGEDDVGGVVSRNFCLAINRLEGDYVVREAVKVGPDGCLEFATEMRESELVDVVRADREQMLSTARVAREGARKELRKAPQTNLCFDCCARRIYLGDDFAIEIEGLMEDGVLLFGAITVGGEIANNGESYLDYYNRTCVVGAFEV